MRAIIMWNRKKRFDHNWGVTKRILIILALFLFSFGILLGAFYEKDGKNTKIPMGMLLKSQVYVGDNTDFLALADVLPQLDEGETSLSQWDVSFYKDEVTKEVIPTFVRTLITESGTESNTVDLVRVPRKSLELASLNTDTPQVLIYSTHTSESYDGGGTVLDAAHALKNTLENTYGIATVVSDTVHDSPEWYKSYANSRQTAQEMLDQYPDAKLIIDLHRDSGKKKSSTTMELDGVSLAKVLLVVGSNLTMEHPNWEENLATSNAVGDAISGVNKEILRGVRVQKGRYNQHLTNRAILLEVGTNLNTVEEACASMNIIGESINNYLATLSY